MSYAFYCSKCRVEHAGECPPAAPLDGSQFDCKGGCGRRTANMTGTCLSCQKACAHHWRLASPILDLLVLAGCTHCGTQRKIGMLTFLHMVQTGKAEKPLDTDPGP